MDMFLAVCRILWLVDLPAETEKRYRQYARSNFLALVKGKEEDVEAIRSFEEAGFITSFRLRKLFVSGGSNQPKHGAKTKSLKL
jgi:hypothetical protein